MSLLSTAGGSGYYGSTEAKRASGGGNYGPATKPRNVPPKKEDVEGGGSWRDVAKNMKLTSKVNDPLPTLSWDRLAALQIYHLRLDFSDVLPTLTRCHYLINHSRRHKILLRHRKKNKGCSKNHAATFKSRKNIRDLRYDYTKID